MRVLLGRCSDYFVVLTAGLLCVAAQGATTSQARLAVVFANSSYSSLGELRNPAQDGQLVSAALRSAGFNVVLKQDLSDEEFRAALRQLARDSSKYDVTLVYYAGHGVQLDGINYLLPVDIKPPEETDDIRLGSVSADEVLSVIKSRYKILVLDACRENPVLGKALSRGRGIGYKEGLAPVSPVSAESGGVFVAYSTQANAVAQDGEGANSPFAASFAKRVSTNVSIDDMFALVTRDVLLATNGFQRPFKYASMDVVFCLTGSCIGGTNSTNAPIGVAGGMIGDTQQLTDTLRRLAINTPEGQRAAIEQSLSEQLRLSLPRTVPYGFLKTKDGKNVAYGFDPASVRFEGREASVLIRTFDVSAKGILTETGWTAHEIVDCTHNQLMQKDWQQNGTVKLFTQAEQKSSTVTLDAGSVGEGLEGALCTSLSFVPLWAVNNVNWVRIGPQAEVAEGVTFQDVDVSDVRYIFGRIDRSPLDTYGGNSAYGWLGINCKTREFDANRGYSLTKRDGSIHGVFGNPGKWLPIGDQSPANNAYVLLCDAP